MKYEVKMSCGHESTVELFGKNEERERKIKYLESNGICPHCQAAEKKATLGEVEEVEMHYSEYKNNYADCKTVPGSYDKKNKTIVVYVPVKPASEETLKVVEKIEQAEATEAHITKESVIAEIHAAAQKVEEAAQISLRPRDEAAYLRVITRLRETIEDMDSVDDFSFKFHCIDNSKKFLSVYYTMLDRKFNANDDFDRGTWRALEQML